MSETWMPIPGYEGLYEVSDLGRIMALPKSRRPRAFIVAQRSNPSHKYLTCDLLDADGRRRQVKVYRLVAQAFLGQTEVPHLSRREGTNAPRRQEGSRLMSTYQERADEARQEAREHPDCIGCALGIWHDHDNDEEDQ